MWASTLGEPEQGADIVARAIRLNPRYPVWAAKGYGSAYFMAGRYEDALRMLDRVSPDQMGTWLWPQKAGALAALGRSDEAAAAVADALKWFPNLAAETMWNDVSYSEIERIRLVETMTLAGFPRCVTAEALEQLASKDRLPGCPLH
jgi:tetratricopeptide (TPR) repeat protein